MRVNVYIAQATGMSRRSADTAIAEGRVYVNDVPVKAGKGISESDWVTLDGELLRLKLSPMTILFHKPAGVVCSRAGQGNKTVYDILPATFGHLKPAGRLDKETSGLLLLTNDGQLSFKLTHPKHQKEKIYALELDKPLSYTDRLAIENGVRLQDGISKFAMSGRGKKWKLRLREGRNRQIRRTFEALSYEVIRLHRLKFGPYELGDLAPGKFKML